MTLTMCMTGFRCSTIVAGAKQGTNTDIDIVNVNGHSNVIRAMSMSLLGQAAESGTSPGTAAQKPQHRSAAAVGWLGQDHIIIADDMASLIRSPTTCYI